MELYSFLNITIIFKTKIHTPKPIFVFLLRSICSKDFWKLFQKRGIHTKIYLHFLLLVFTNIQKSIARHLPI
jgi:hypothetical protein